MHPDINNFLEALKPFERGGNFDSNLLEKYYRTIMTKLVEENAPKKTFYIAMELVQNEMARGEFTLPVGYKLVPDLFMFKVIKGNDYVPAKDPDFKIRFPKNKDKYTINVEKFVASMLIYRANYELLNGKKERAKVYLEKIRNDIPGFRIPGNLIQQVYDN